MTAQMLANWQASGLEGTKWCKRENIPYTLFKYWKKKLIGGQKHLKLFTTPFNAFLELKEETPTSQRHQSIEIEANGFTIRLNGSFDPNVLRPVLQLVKEL